MEKTVMTNTGHRQKFFNIAAGFGFVLSNGDNGGHKSGHIDIGLTPAKTSATTPATQQG